MAQVQATRPSEDRIWEVIGKAGVAMLVTTFEGGLRGRPLEARPDREEGAIYFLTDIRGLKDDEIAHDAHICLTFVYPDENVYLSVTGTAEVRVDTERARKLWNRKQEAWWEGPQDPSLRVIRVDPCRAEIWDGPASSAVAAFEFAKARLTGEKPDVGEKRKTTVTME